MFGTAAIQQNIIVCADQRMSIGTSVVQAATAVHSTGVVTSRHRCCLEFRSIDVRYWTALIWFYHNRRLLWHQSSNKALPAPWSWADKIIAVKVDWTSISNTLITANWLVSKLTSILLLTSHTPSSASPVTNRVVHYFQTVPANELGTHRSCPHGTSEIFDCCVGSWYCQLPMQQWGQWTVVIW